MGLHVQSCKLVHVSGIHCHVRASSTSGYAFVYFTVQYRIEYSSTASLFQAQMSGSKCKSSGDVAGTAKKHQGIKMKKKSENNWESGGKKMFFYVLFVWKVL